MSGDLTIVAGAFDYPEPGARNRLRVALSRIQDGSVGKPMEKFVHSVEQYDLGAWEELHTRTLDLSPLFVPYVGHVMWGENYRRGEFMANLQAAMREGGIDQGGELPDHIAPVLRLVDSGAPAPDDLHEVLPSAIDEMRKQLKKAERANPYRHLLTAAAEAVDAHRREGAAL